jgi:uncharacterized protein
MSAPTSPCVKICVVDPVSRLCIGCGRTIAEISLWSEMDEAKRLSVMIDLPPRLVSLGSRAARGGRVRARNRS